MLLEVCLAGRKKRRTKKKINKNYRVEISTFVTRFSEAKIHEKNITTKHKFVKMLYIIYFIKFLK